MKFVKSKSNEVYGYEDNDSEELITQLIGDGWENITDSWPPEPILVSIVPNVTAVQIRLQLNKQGLRTQVETAIASGSQDLKDKWQYGNMFSSTDSDIQAMATSLGLTQEQLDTLFTEAATL